MSIEKCITGLVDAGEITQQQADAALEHIRKRREEVGHAPGSAEEAADLALFATRMKKDAAEQKQRLSLQALRQMEATKRRNEHPGGLFKTDKATRSYYGLMSQLVVDRTLGAKWPSVEQLADGYKRALQGMFTDGIDLMRSKVAGLKNETIAMKDFIREVFGDNTGSPGARSAAASWSKMIDWSVKEWGSLGGNLAEKDNWRIPQTHDRLRMSTAGEAQWKADVLGMVAHGKARLPDFERGGKVDLEGARRDAVLSEMYQTLTTGGANKIDPGKTKATTLANKRNMQRKIEFTNPDGWLEYHNMYGPGEGQIFDMLTSYMDGMAHDLAMLKWGGPNPEHTFRVQLDEARKDGISPKRAAFLQYVWDATTGAAFSPVSDTLARVGGETRSWLSSTQLGSAFLSAVGADHLSAGMTALFNGVPAWKVMTQYVSLMNPSNKADRISAWRMGLGAESQVHRFQGAARHHLEMQHGIGGKLAEFVMRSSLLSHHTDQLQHAVGWEFLGHLADDAGKKYSALDRPTQWFLERYGLDEKAWDVMRSNLFDADGLPLMDPHHLVGLGGDAADAGVKLLGGIAAEQRIATPNPGAYERAIMMRGNRPGTPVGEALASFWQYKGFSVSVLTQHIMRGIAQMRREGAYWYLPGFVIGSTLMGALAMQLKAVAQGKDPRPVDEGRFWSAALYQGGGFGIMGDYLYGAMSRSDKTMFLSLMGPTAGLAADITALGFSNVGEVLREKDTNFGRELARFSQAYTPGSTLWYSRLAADRWLWNSLQEWADPRYRESFRRMEQRAWDENGQKFWWRPGSSAPQRAPQ